MYLLDILACDCFKVKSVDIYLLPAMIQLSEYSHKVLAE